MKHCEKAKKMQTLRESRNGSPFPQPLPSSSGAHGQAPIPFLSEIPCVLTDFFSHRGLLFREHEPGKVQYCCHTSACSSPRLEYAYIIQRYARKLRGRVFGEMIQNVCTRLCADNSGAVAPNYRLPLCSTRPSRVMYLPHSSSSPLTFN